VSRRTAPRGQLLDSALRHLNEAGLDVTEIPADASSDTLLRVTAPAGTRTYDVHVEPRVSPGSAAAIQSPPEHGLLVVAPYVSDSVADLLRHMDIHYVDSVGNMYLRWPGGLLLDIRGHHRPAAPRPADLDKPLRAFKPTGLKVLFTLLTEADLVTANYREIAAASGTSLGTVQWVLKELEQVGYVDTATPVRQLHRVRELFDRWVSAYALDLHPRLTLGRFDAPDPKWWTSADVDLVADGALWGGETAAHRLHRRLRPGRVVVYATAIPRRLVINHRLHKSAGEGSVEIRERFWQRPESSTDLTVPTPLIYADLVSSAEPRQLEAAAYLREHDDLLRRIDRG
jgi:hypothetical protein